MREPDRSVCAIRRKARAFVSRRAHYAVTSLRNVGHMVKKAKQYEPRRRLGQAERNGIKLASGIGKASFMEGWCSGTYDMINAFTRKLNGDEVPKSKL